MPSTEDFEYLLEKPNVIGVGWNEKEGRVEVRVSQKVPESELPDDAIVNRVVKESDGPAEETNVVDEGFGEDVDGYAIEFRPTAEPTFAKDAGEGPLRQRKIRPVPGGVSTGHPDVNAGTSGPYPVRVADKDKGNWGDNVSEGDVVRLSNNHIWANKNKADIGDSITQPASFDGGDTDEHTVGKLAGYVRVEDGVKVDVAARTVTQSHEDMRYHGLPVDYGSEVWDKSASELDGKRVCKTGRTSGVLEGKVKYDSYTIKVNFGGDLGAVKMKDQIIAEYISTGGDSGSPIFKADTGELVGMNFAGSPNSTIFNFIGNIENDFGVEVLEPAQIFQVVTKPGIAGLKTEEVAMKYVVENKGSSTVNAGMKLEAPEQWQPTRVRTDADHIYVGPDGTSQSPKAKLYLEDIEPQEVVEFSVIYTVPDVAAGHSKTFTGTMGRNGGQRGSFDQNISSKVQVVESMISWINDKIGEEETDKVKLFTAVEADRLYRQGRITEDEALRIIRKRFPDYNI